MSANNDERILFNFALCACEEKLEETVDTEESTSDTDEYEVEDYNVVANNMARRIPLPSFDMFEGCHTPSDLNDFRLLTFQRNRLFLNDKPFNCRQEWFVPIEEFNQRRNSVCQYSFEERERFWKQCIIAPKRLHWKSFSHSEAGYQYILEVFHASTLLQSNKWDHYCNVDTLADIARNILTTYTLALTNVQKQRTTDEIEPRSTFLSTNHWGESQSTCELEPCKKIGELKSSIYACRCKENTWSGQNHSRWYMFRSMNEIDHDDIYANGHSLQLSIIQNCINLFSSTATSSRPLLSFDHGRFQARTSVGNRDCSRMFCIRRCNKRLFELFPILKQFINFHTELHEQPNVLERVLCELYLDSSSFNDHEQNKFAVSWDHFDFYEYLTNDMWMTITKRYRDILGDILLKKGIEDEDFIFNELERLCEYYSMYRVFSDEFEILDRHTCDECHKSVPGTDIRIASFLEDPKQMTIQEMFEHEYKHSLIDKESLNNLVNRVLGDDNEFNADLPDWNLFYPYSDDDYNVLFQTQMKEFTHICVNCLKGDNWYYLVGDKGNNSFGNNCYRGWYIHKQSLNQLGVLGKPMKNSRF